VQNAQEIAELQQVSLQRTDDQAQKAKQYDQGAASQYWEDLILQLIVKHSSKDGSKNPPRLGYQFALFTTAMYDAGVATWAAKYCYNRPAPSVLAPGIRPVVPVRPEPSYPSEHAAMAWAAITIMKPLFPCPDVNDTAHCEETAASMDARAAEASESRIWAGTNYRSDIDAGKAIGVAVGNAILAARVNDGHSAKWDPSTMPTGPCIWKPTPPAFKPPVEPLWGHVAPFVMSSGDQFRTPPKYADCNSPEFMTETQDLYQTSKTLTDREKSIANYWAGGQGTETPPGMNFHIAFNETTRHSLNTMRHIRVMAYDGVSEGDAGIAVWDMKYAYWLERPVNTIERVIEPGWLPYIVTPPFPGYASGHSGFSATSAVVLAHFFPDDAIQLRSMATEAGDSRFYGGIHIHQDNEEALHLGDQLGGLILQRAANDGADA